MKAIIYGKPGDRVLEAASAGLKLRGYSSVFQRPSVFTPDQAETTADVVVVFGLQATGASILARYHELGIKVIVIDVGYIDREAGFYSVGWDGLNAIQPAECPGDRFKLIKPREKAKKGTATLLLGQCPGDAQLPVNYDPKVWALAKAKQYDNPVWKAHPKHPVEIPGVASVDSFDGAKVAVTYNSTAAYECFLRGIPVISDSACYQELTCTADNIVPPSEKDLQAFMNRLAYSQWTLEEIASGAAFDVLFDGPPVVKVAAPKTTEPKVNKTKAKVK